MLHEKIDKFRERITKFLSDPSNLYTNFEDDVYINIGMIIYLQEIRYRLSKLDYFCNNDDELTKSILWIIENYDASEFPNIIRKLSSFRLSENSNDAIIDDINSSAELINKTFK